MSYILDALRRADAERSRGAVPGLHAQSVPADGEPAARNFNPLIWAAGGAGLLLLAVVCVLVFGPWKTASVPGAQVALAPAPQLAPAVHDNVSAQDAQGELAPALSGAIDPGARPIEPPIGHSNPPSAYPPLAAPRTATREPPAQRVAAGRVATLEPRAAAQVSAPAVEHYGAPVQAASAPAPALAHANAVVNITELAPDVRAQLPRLAVGGAIYSETPSARMVILNGQVFHEGDKPAADTVLEQIRLKSAVLNFRGQRYEVSF